MMTLNKVILTGILVKDLIFKELDDSSQIAIGRLYTNDFWEDEKGVKHQVMDYHNLIFKSDQAGVALYRLRQNDLIYVDGKLKYRNWTSKDGTQQITAEIIVSSFKALNSGNF